MTMNLLRRKYRIVFLILIVGTIYLCFQFFSLKVLNFTSKRETIKYKQQIEGKDLDGPAFSYNEKFVGFNEGPDDRARVIGVNVDEGKVEIKIIDTNHEDGNVGEKDLDKPLGVHFTQTEQYRRRTDGMFQCLYSKELIPYETVNDDYCDCKDSTDEPGTSACPESKFYCTFQTADKPFWLPSSRVNDGLCDCCDGSDEMAGIQVFSGIHLTDKRLETSLTHTPCHNHCEEKQKANENDIRIRKLGNQLKQSYINSGKTANKELYGPDGVFYKLSLTCFEFDTTEYKYKFCPFKSVTQQKFTDSPTTLGRDPVWKVKSGDNYVLEMRNGEAQRCPGGHPRTSIVTFICGLTDKIVSLAEEEKCVYKMKFSTPAAC